MSDTRIWRQKLEKVVPDDYAISATSGNLSRRRRIRRRTTKTVILQLFFII